MIDFIEFYIPGSNVLNLPNQGLTASHIPVLIDFLKNHAPIDTLNLSRNKLGAEGTLKLIKALSELTSPIKTLNLSHNNLGEEGIKNVALFNDTITDVNLSNNQGGENCLETFAKYNDTVTSLDLSSNSIGNKSLKDFSLINKKVRQLTLNYSNITTSGVIEFSKHNKVVWDIILQGNGIDDNGAKALAFNKAIRTADLKSNRQVTQVGKGALNETNPEIKAKFGIELGIAIEPVKIASLLELTILKTTKYLKKYDLNTKDSDLPPDIDYKLNNP